MITERYQQQLISVSDALEEKRPYTSEGRRKVILLQDNSQPHTIKRTLETITDLGRKILSHPTYSLYLTSSDYHPFRYLQHHLSDTHFTSVEEMNKSIIEFIASKQPSFFRC